MSLEQVIEADMAQFLDSAVTPVERADAPRQEDAAYAYANKDWEAETKTMLKRNDLDGAKKLFAELKERYNRSPVEHTEERKRLYETVQACYLQIVNYSTDRQKTTELLTHMEQGPSDVFNVNVRAVNLQVEDHYANSSPAVSGRSHSSAAPSVIVVQASPQPQQITLPARAAPISSPVASPQEPLAAPPVPQFVVATAPAQQVSAPSPATAAAPSSLSTANMSSAPAPMPQLFRPEKSRDEIISASVRKTLQDAMTLAKTDPGAGLTLLKGIGETVMTEEQGGRLTHATASLLLGQIESLEHAMRAGEERRRFATEFSAQLSALTHLARTKHEDALPAYDSLRQKAEAFEKSYPAYAGEFTSRLDAVQEQYSLLDEDAIVERLTPLLLRIKVSRAQGDRRGLLDTLEDLSHFTNTLPHVQERALLETIVTKLRARALGFKAVPSGTTIRTSTLRETL